MADVADVAHQIARAQEILDDPVLTNAFETVSRMHIEAALRAKTDEDRRWALDKVNACREVRALIKAQLDNEKSKLDTQKRRPLP